MSDIVKKSSLDVQTENQLFNKTVVFKACTIVTRIFAYGYKARVALA
jgi:hypothetical protein